jgi:hypothetical protein
LLLDRTLRYIRAFIDNYKEYFFNKSNELIDIKVDDNTSIAKGIDHPFSQIIEEERVDTQSVTIDNSTNINTEIYTNKEDATLNSVSSDSNSQSVHDLSAIKSN